MRDARERSHAADAGVRWQWAAFEVLLHGGGGLLHLSGDEAHARLDGRRLRGGLLLGLLGGLLRGGQLELLGDVEHDLCSIQ